ncbi:response regulator [Altericista sp. CCNU0014]|uniref:response regulator n=1 Tax=Altericista sp. CCNU0014 TaxID=3082949 RepID=UPI00384BA23D
MSEPRMTVLHVEDNEANRYVVARILRNAGFTVIEAATGIEGLEAIAQHQPDLVVLDVKLPDLNGFEVCRKIKSDPKTARIPVLHLSATFVQSQDKAEGLDSGADAYLVQPVEPIELVATVRSLLRIRRAEEVALASAREWQTTFDSIKDSVCLVDREGKILRSNRSMSQLLGKPSHEILGRVHHELIRSVLGVGDGFCFRRARETHQRQVLELHPEGRWFAKSVDPVLDENGAFAGAVYILSDITERKRSEVTLKEQNDRLNQLMLSLQRQTEEAQQANRIKDEFLAVLSHELRSPLNPILGWARILRTKQQDEAKTQYALETIERNAKLQAQLIEDLLEVSRILQGKLNLNTSSIDLTSIIKAASETVRLAAEAKSIQIQTVSEPNVGCVLGDSGRLQQVVWNLLSNAVKFTPPGGRVEVRLEKIERERGDEGEMDRQGDGKAAIATPPPSTATAQITVSDTGKGISPDFLPHVFDYFRQADSTTTRKFGGLGLGLAIVRHLVELHGGTVWADSPGEGRGATFVVRLPIAAESRENSPDRLPGDRADWNLNGLHVLCVDDDSDSRELIAFLLEQDGATVTNVESAIEALNCLNQTKFDLIVSDVGMPDMDGYAFIRQVRQHYPDPIAKIPAIALTAYASEIHRQQALVAGFQARVAKPIEPDFLLQAIRTLLEETAGLVESAEASILATRDRGE